MDVLQKILAPLYRDACKLSTAGWTNHQVAWSAQHSTLRALQFVDAWRDDVTVIPRDFPNVPKLFKTEMNKWRFVISPVQQQPPGSNLCLGFAAWNVLCLHFMPRCGNSPIEVLQTVHDSLTANGWDQLPRVRTFLLYSRLCVNQRQLPKWNMLCPHPSEHDCDCARQMKEAVKQVNLWLIKGVESVL